MGNMAAVSVECTGNMVTMVTMDVVCMDNMAEETMASMEEEEDMDCMADTEVADMEDVADTEDMADTEDVADTEVS